jgi:hypothetical protein
VNITEKDKDRFWSKVDKSGDCWLWTGVVHGDGHGKMHISRKPVNVKRISWFVNNGPLQKGLCVFSKCKNKHCVNPDHLWVGEIGDRFNTEKLFMAKVDKSGDCWEWTSGKDQDGYGIFSIKKSVRAHRASYEIHKGPIPPGMCVCHTCDNPGCVNPNHLWVGSITENNSDREQKGRSDFQKGERGHNSKLTNRQALEIRMEYATGRSSHEKISLKYGVSREVIGNITRNKTYKWEELPS